MPRTDLPYTYLAKGRYWRFRHRMVGDVALPGAPGDAAFHARYAELMEAVERRAKEVTPPKSSFRALIAVYRKSVEFQALADATQVDYERTLAIIVDKLGDEPFALTTKAMIRAVRDDFADTPRKAHKVKQMLSALYSWAGDRDLVPDSFNPAMDLKRLRKKGGEREYPVWSPAEFELFMASAIPPMRTAVMLARYTGQRAQDIVRMTWSDYQGGSIRVRQNKTGAPLDIACHAALRTYLDAIKARGRSHVMILLSAAGEPYNANSLSSAIGREVKRIKDMPADRSIHGLRYLAGSDMEDAGCTIGEIQAVLGHHTYRMAMKYATQRLRARSAAAKREGNEA